MDKQGLIQLYTGNGKGKTTAAFGLALRALGHGWRVTILQFMKGDAKYGEVCSMALFPNCQIMRFGRDTFVDYNNPDPADLELAKQGFEVLENIFTENSCDLLILDEINVALALKLLPEEEVVTLLTKRPPNMEVVLTGRYAPQSIQQCADLITEMQPLKHPFETGIPAREGIEF